MRAVRVSSRDRLEIVRCLRGGRGLSVPRAEQDLRQRGAARGGYLGYDRAGLGNLRTVVKAEVCWK